MNKFDNHRRKSITVINWKTNTQTVLVTVYSSKTKKPGWIIVFYFFDKSWQNKFTDCKKPKETTITCTKSKNILKHFKIELCLS